jgi:WD40 repeat protein
MDEAGIRKICRLMNDLILKKQPSDSSTHHSSVDTMMSEMLSAIDQLHYQFKDGSERIKGALTDLKGALISLMSSVEIADQFFQHSQQKAIESLTLGSPSIPCQILATNIRLISTLYLQGYLSTYSAPLIRSTDSQGLFNIFNDFIKVPLVQQSLLLEFDPHQHIFEHLWRKLMTDSNQILSSATMTLAGGAGGGGDGTADGTTAAAAEYYHNEITQEVHVLQSVFQTYAHHEYHLISPPTPPSLTSSKEERQLELCDLQLMIGHHQQVNSMVLLVKEEQTNLLITASSDLTIKLWNLDHQQEVMTWTGHQAPITTLSISDDYLYSSDELGYLKIWDLEILTEIASNPTRSQVITCLAISSDQIYCGYQDGHILSLDIDSYHEILSFKAHSTSVHQIVLSQNNLLISCGKIVKIWNQVTPEIGITTRECELVMKLRGHDHAVTSLLIKDQILYTAARSIRQWDLSTNKKEVFPLLGEFKKHSHEIKALVIDGERLYSVGRVIRVWDLVSYQLVHILSGYTSPIKTLALSDRKVYTACEARSEIQVRRLEY